MNRKKVIGICAAAVVAVGAASLGSYFYVKGEVEAVPAHVICDNVFIEGIEVSGMTEAEAKEAVEAGLSHVFEQKISLNCEDALEVQSTYGEIGLQFENLDEVTVSAVSVAKDGNVFERYRALKNLEKETVEFDLGYALNQETTTAYLAKAAEGMTSTAKDATITRENGQFIITEDVAGITLDVEASVTELAKEFDETWEYEGEAAYELVSTVQEAKITAEALSHVQDKLGSFTTSFTNGNNRSKNIALATSKINGSILMPGEEFSTSNTMGSRNAANGYLTAGAYLNGEVVDSYGGGVCQVSTTLYNAVINAELEVTMRYAHSMVVDYVKPSMDAAIAEGSKDFKFKNNTEYPIYICGYKNGGSITFEIYGAETREEGRTVKYESKTLSTTECTSKFTASGDYEIGTVKKTSSGHTGKKAELWKVVYKNGVEVSRELFNTSSYAMSPHYYSVGVKSTNTEATALVKNAVSSQNRDSIDAAIAQAKALIAAAQTPVETPAAE